MHDDDFFDVPAGYTDADIETAELVAAGRAESARRKRGQCSHTWTGPAADDAHPERYTCYHCGFLWPNRAATDRHWRNCQLGDCQCASMVQS